MSTPTLPFVRMADVAVEPLKPHWLVESLWAAAGVGVLGGQPKTCKTWLALDMAISVASGTPCLDSFAVPHPGPVLVFLAEDSATNARERVRGICHHRGLDIAALDLFLITTPSLRLDLVGDIESLEATIASLRPTLLLLDPFVRLHAADENSSSDVSRLLGQLRHLQRTYDLAILLVHHLRKNGHSHPGLALRGSSDVHAWGDSNAYLHHRSDSLSLTLEHRSAPAIEPFSVQLVTHDDGTCPHLACVEQTNDDGAPCLAARVLEVLSQADHPLTRTALRAQLRVNNKRLGDALTQLDRDGQILRGAHGWSVVFRSSSPLDKPRNGTGVIAETAQPNLW